MMNLHYWLKAFLALTRISEDLVHRRLLTADNLRVIGLLPHGLLLMLSRGRHGEQGIEGVER